MIVADHKPPLRRIELGSKPADKRRASEITEAMSGVGPTERDRIWRLVEQVARGVSMPDPVAEDLGGVLVPDDVAEALRTWIADNGGF